MPNSHLARSLINSLIFLMILSIGMSGCITAPVVSPTEAGTSQENTGIETNVETANSGNDSRLSIFHYFNDTLGRKSIDEVIALFHEKYPDIDPLRNPMDHEAYKVAIPALLAGDSQPDVFSYWAGARTQFIVDSDYLQPIDDLWAEDGLDQGRALAVC